MSRTKRDSNLPDYALVERQEMMIGCGQGDEAMNRPQIGVVSSWGEVNPASVHLDKVAQSVKAGIWASGGAPREFVISSICTSMAGNDRFHLPHRDLVAGYIETVAMTTLLDGLVFLPVCDDVIPGHLMAAARLDLPSVVVTGGYMQMNRHRGSRIDPLDVAPKHFREYKEGRMDGADYRQIRNKGCPGIGACPVMGTANTMAAMVEALGMSLTGNATVPGADSRLHRLAFESGRQVMALLDAGITPSKIMRPEAFDNAIRLLMAIGGSTNAVLHLQAVALELGLDIEPERFNRISGATPFICDVTPSGPGKYFLPDLDEAGGIASVMKELLPLLDKEVLTVSGSTMAENLSAVPKGNRAVIRALDEPIAEEGGLIFLTGSLAPNGALVKKAAVPESMRQHTGPARIFADEDSACAALLADEISPGTVVVVRYMGPKGDPGMRLLQRFLWMLSAKGMQDKIAFLTDGRFSGTNKGCAVAHIGPEAAGGGPLAVLQDGDPVKIDIPGRRLDVEISPEELEKRLAEWTPMPKKVKKGWLSIYSDRATSTEKGAALDYQSTK